MKKIWSASNPVRPDRNPSHLAGKCQNLILKRAPRQQYIQRLAGAPILIQGYIQGHTGWQGHVDIYIFIDCQQGLGFGSGSGSAWICIKLSCWIRISIQKTLARGTIPMQYRIFSGHQYIISRQGPQYQNCTVYVGTGT